MRRTSERAFFRHSMAWLKDRGYVANMVMSAFGDGDDDISEAREPVNAAGNIVTPKKRKRAQLPPWVKRSGRAMQVADLEDEASVAFVQLMVNSGTQGVFAPKPGTPNLAKPLPGWDISNDPAAIKRVLHENRPANLGAGWRGGWSGR